MVYNILTNTSCNLLLWTVEESVLWLSQGILEIVNNKPFNFLINMKDKPPRIRKTVHIINILSFYNTLLLDNQDKYNAMRMIVT